MKNRLLIALALGLVLVPAAGRADIGSVFGVAGNPSLCDDTTAPYRLGAATNANLFAMSNLTINGPANILWNVKDNTHTNGGPTLSNGGWFLVRNNISPLGDRVWVVITHYDPADTNLTDHDGLMSVDSYPVGQNGNRQVLQALNITRPVPSGQQGGTTAGRVTGFDVRFSALDEFDPTGNSIPNPVDTTPPNCQLGGDVNAASPGDSDQVIIGYNVYRLNAATTPSGISTPAHYLGGPDANYQTGADNGWIGFVTISSVAGPGRDVDVLTGADLDAAGDLYGVEPGLSVIYSDAIHLPGAPATLNPTAPPNSGGNITGSYTYAFQPVLRMSGNLAGFQVGASGTKVDRDGLPGVCGAIDWVDNNGDTLAEFIDPSGCGLGLVYQDATVSAILISGDSEVTGAAALPADGTVDFSASYSKGVFSLNFSSSMGTNVAGYNIYPRPRVRPTGRSTRPSSRQSPTS